MEDKVSGQVLPSGIISRWKSLAASGNRSDGDSQGLSGGLPHHNRKNKMAAVVGPTEQ